MIWRHDLSCLLSTQLKQVVKFKSENSGLHQYHTGHGFKSIQAWMFFFFRLWFHNCFVSCVYSCNDQLCPHNDNHVFIVINHVFMAMRWCLAMYIMRLGLGNITAVFASAIFKRLWTSLEDFRHLQKFKDFFKNLQKWTCDVRKT